MSETCEHCRFWDRFDAGEPDGLCRRGPPSPAGASGLEGDYESPACGVWPQTLKTDWCGEFEARAPALPDSLLSCPVGHDKLGLSGRALSCLLVEGIVTVGDLVSRSADQLLHLRNFGYGSLDSVRKGLGRHGLRLRDDPPPGAGGPYDAP